MVTHRTAGNPHRGGWLRSLALATLAAAPAVHVSGCRSPGGVMAADAAINTALATGAGAASVSSGGCFADCPTGTVCNHATGLCDALPCHGQCKDGEVCDEAGLVPRCVQVNGPVVNRQAGAPPPPDATPAAAAAPTAPASAPPPASPAAPAAYPSDAPTR